MNRNYARHKGLHEQSQCRQRSAARQACASRARPSLAFTPLDRATTERASDSHGARRKTRHQHNWLRRNYLSQYAAQTERWLDAEHEWPSEWTDRLGFSDVILEVSPERLANFHAEFEALAQKYKKADDPASSRKVLFITQAIPLDLTPPMPS